MKNFVTCVIIFLSLQLTDQPSPTAALKGSIHAAGNIFIITLDGFRWQEIFTGADPALINNERYTPDTATMKMLYWSPDAEGRRKKLLPFFWNVIARKGQLFGNRYYHNKMNTANNYSISYPGYNEIFTGNTDISISSNNKLLNPNITVLEYLNTLKDFHGKVAAFTSWDVFPYIFNKKRNSMVINSGYENMDDRNDPGQTLVNKVQEVIAHDKTTTRHDLLTFITAKDFIQLHRPRVMYLGLGESDEAAHDARYDIYLERAAAADRMIAELWHWVQTTPGYKNNTTFIITTDHGRGKTGESWQDHGLFIPGSSQTWLALIGPTIEATGEVREEQQLYQKQLAQTMAALLGESFTSSQPITSVAQLK